MLNQLLPSLQSMGVWGYWLVGLMAFLEALVLTSVFAPGTVVVVLGGALAAQGFYDWGDMIWFVAVGTCLGAELSYRIGTKGEALFQGGRPILSSQNLERGRRFFTRYGAASIVIGHFFGPLRPVAPVIAGVSHMPHRAFVLWNIVGSAAYAAVFVGIGFFFGTTFGVLGPATTRVGLFLLGVLAAVAVLWFLVVRVRRALPLAASVLRSIGRAIRDNPDVQAVARRHPRVVRILGARLSRGSFMGLPATLLGAAFLYFLVLYAGLTEDYVTQDPIVQLDRRLANLLFAFRDPALVRFFTGVTTFGYSVAILILAVAVSVVLWLGRRLHYVPGLWLALIGNQLTVTLLKHIFARPRSDLAVYAESSLSFPSGHSAVGAAFYGFLTYLLLRERIGPALLWILTGASLVFLIGLSRIYLGEHYLSDVLNGMLVGALWALLGVFLAEWLNSRRPHIDRAPVRAWHRLAGAGVVAVAALALVFVVRDYHQALNPRAVAIVTRLSGSVEEAFATGQLPARSENILGTPEEPISLVILAPDEVTLVDAFAKAGWPRAERPGFATLSRAAVAAWLNRADATAPVTPAFWNGRPNDLAFEAAVPGQGLRQRHHARLWATGFRSPGGQLVFVGTASLDDGLKWGLTHRIDPNIDAERDRVAADLEGAGDVARGALIRTVSPVLGENLTGDPFFTDGQAVVLEIGPEGQTSRPNTVDGPTP